MINRTEPRRSVAYHSTAPAAVEFEYEAHRLVSETLAGGTNEY
jgi:hypothetical protein